ncbi:hypothetical protein ACFL4G_10265 [Thermodesulfobacteriota bacterium]
MRSFSVTALLLLLVIPGIASAGAWTQPKGVMYNRMSVNYYRSTAAYGTDGGLADLDKNGVFEDYNFTWYQEYGLLERLTLITSIPYKFVHHEDDAFKSNTWGPGDIDVAARIRLFEKPFILGLQPLVKLPYGYDEDEDVPIGNGQADFEIRLLFGRSLHPLPAYAGVEIGYRFRAGDPSDEIRYLAEAGCTFTPRISARIKLDGTLSAENGAVGTAGFNQTLTNEFDLGKLEVTTIFRIRENLFIEGTWTPTVYGENTSQGHTFSLALAGTFKPGRVCGLFRGEDR